MRVAPIVSLLVLLGSGCRTAVPAAEPCAAQAPARKVHRASFSAGGRTLTLEVLDDDLLHVALGGTVAAIPTSPMVQKTDYPGPTRLEVERGGTLLRTAELRVEVDPRTLAVSARYLRTGRELTSVRPTEGGLSVARAGARNVYGLGQQLTDDAAADWIGRVREPGSAHGNRMVPFHGGAVGNVQIPVLYALGQGRHGYALFVDQPEAQRWDFRADPWTLALKSKGVRYYLIAGPDLPDLRRDYMELTGRPPVPPRAALGLWVSEYGYRGWDEVEGKLASLRASGIPVSGFVLDLFWFGGIERGSPTSRMGSLRWDEQAFPEPARHIAELARRGVGIIPIEESYVSKGLPEHAVLAEAGYLVRRCREQGCAPASMDSWWGLGGMIDWTDPAAGDFWHDYRRAALVRAGVAGHWADLGEPEDFDPAGRYHGLPPAHEHGHDAVANLYNLAWVASIDRGYRRQGATRRTFVLTRSGAAGIQRHGAALWSGDIGSNMVSLRAHLAAQAQMSLSGIDYHGSDIGGFKREALDGEVGALYTRWLACGAALDVPVRPHTNNLSREHETAPDRVGDLQSNRANIRLRRRLGPYLYGLAHRAHREGEAVFPPLVYYFQDDPRARRLALQRMIGPFLMVALAPHFDPTADVYLPEGEWFDYHDGRRLSGGRWLRAVSLVRDGRFTLPLLARAGALIPERPEEGEGLVLRVFPGGSSQTVLFEDDGASVAYLGGNLRRTPIRQVTGPGGAVTVTVGPTLGSYAGARPRRLELVLLRGEAQGVVEIPAIGARRVTLRPRD